MPHSVAVVKTFPVYGDRTPSGVPACDPVDGLRGVAVGVLVAGMLAGNGFPGSPVATSVLLVLTGYLVTAHMAREARHTGRLDLRAMWQRRAVRWVPVLWLTMAAIALGSVVGVWPEVQLRDIPGETLAALVNMSNWWRLASPDRLADAIGCPEAALWFTSVVEQAVVVWSLLFAGAFMAHRRGWSFVVPALLVACGGAAVWFTVGNTADPVVAALHTGVRFGEVVMGATLAWVWRRRGLRGPRRPDLRLAVMVTWPVCTLALLVMALAAPATSQFWSHGGYLAAGLAATGLVAGAVSVGSLRSTLEWTPLVAVGRRAGVALFVAWPTRVAVPADWGPVVAAVIVLVVCAVAMLLVDRLPIGAQLSDAARSERMARPDIAGAHHG